MEYLILINNVLLGSILFLVAIMSMFLFKYIKIFNDIYENTNKLKEDLKKLNRTLTPSEIEELSKPFD